MHRDGNGPDPRSLMGILSIRGCKWGNFNPRGDLNRQKKNHPRWVNRGQERSVPPRPRSPPRNPSALSNTKCPQANATKVIGPSPQTSYKKQCSSVTLAYFSSQQVSSRRRRSQTSLSLGLSLSLSLSQISKERKQHHEIQQ